MKQKQRWLAMLLSVLMVWTMLPAQDCLHAGFGRRRA